MIIKTEQVKLVLYNTALTGYFLEKSGIGISRQAISQLRNKGEENFEKLPLETVMKVQKWIDEGNYKFSYDYENIIANLEDDIEDGNVSDKIYVLRDAFDERLGFAPILGYYVSLDDVAEGDTVQEMSVEIALREMKTFNEIF
ncbi:hypothetical protein [Streptococcus uberis]|uniref:hypothetical protein n=1 Tax=Streptococcus uberis TaxID=1349 RepID=UPI0006203B2A|nr:hypothetical protein [Streptococcus uberis]KKF40841.1 hypothetical protein AF64_08675 [Streptococcus uberis C9359]KKF51696.1 hypothetical protein AF65_08735 [Streptococcus uberis C5388]QBX22057.1 hypothetical protein Javan633_0004 [Streptococcus phage Javan633]QBX31248.1 hypothetical protein Javan628_0004 [Streptococcus phage Javan628]